MVYWHRLQNGGAYVQKRSHKLLASTLLQSRQGLDARRYEFAFLFGSFQPDCNPLTYLKGSVRARALRGHNFSNSSRYIASRIHRLQHCERWTIWQYYTLGKLTHYLADAFTYPHNETFSDSLAGHHNYERELRQHLAAYLQRHSFPPNSRPQNVFAAIASLHQRYLSSAAGIRTDTRYIVEAAELLMVACLPPSKSQKTA